MSQAVVVIGGGTLTQRALDAVRPEATVIAADSGLDHAVAAGLRPHVLVGDFDSISAAGRMWAYAHELEIHEHPVDKDLTDAELAIRRALDAPDLRQLLVIGGLDDPADQRFDHLLGMLLALGHPLLAGVGSVKAVLADTQFQMMHPGKHTVLDLEAGQTFSLLALHGPCRGVTVNGARWPLANATLDGTEARGVSNEGTERTEVQVESGVLTVVIP